MMSKSRRLIFPLLAVILTVAVTIPVALAVGPGEAAGAPRPGQAVRPVPVPSRTDFIVLIWYRRDDPLGTFEHQIYDVRKGEYTPAVDDWVRETRAKYPGYVVLMKSVDLSRERGQTEKLKVGSVIQRYLMIAATESGVILGAPVNAGAVPSGGQSQAPRSLQMPAPDRTFLNPGPNPLNIPVYPRTRTP